MSTYDAKAYWKKQKNKENEIKSSPANTSKKGYDAKAYWGKIEADKTVNFATLQTDLNSLFTTIGNAYDGWQTRETMKNTLSSVQSMYNRIGTYQDYQKKYGGADLSELQGNLKSIMTDWDELSRQYARHKDADSYNTSVKNAKKTLAEEEQMKKADLNVVRSEYNDLEKLLNTAKEYDGKINKGIPNVRSRTDAEKYLNSFNQSTKERDDYLKSIGYDSMDALKDAVGEKKKFLNRAEWLQKGIELSSVNAKDFEEKSKYVAPKEKSGIFFGSNDEVIYKYINDENYRNQVITTAKVNNSADAAMFGIGYEYMTDDEKKLYNYYYNSGDKKKANEYIHTITETLGSRKAVADAEKFKGNTVKEMLYGVNAGFDQFSTGMKNLFNFEDEYIPVNSTQQLSGLIRDDLNYEHGNWGTVPYDFITTTSNMLPSVLTSTLVGKINPTLGANVGAALLGASASGNAYQEMLNLGYDKAQSRVYSGLVGVSEATLQRVMGGISSLGGVGKLSGKVTKALNSVDNAFGRFAINYGKSVLAEGFEESAQEILTPIFKSIVTGENMEEIDWGQVAYSGLLGMMSGGLWEGVPQIANARSEVNIGKDIKAKERTQDLFDLANNPEITEAYETYARWGKKGINADNVTNAQLGRLYNEVRTDAVGKVNSKKSTEEQRDKAKTTLDKLAIVGTENTIKKESKKFNIGEESKVTETNTNINIKDLKFKGDKVSVATDKGEISVDDVTLTQNDAEVVALASEISKVVGEDVANLFISEYDNKVSVDEYANAFNLSMVYAKNNFDQDTILSKRGPLSTKLVNGIYEATIINDIRARESSIEELVEKHGKTMTIKGVFDDSIIDRNNSTTDGSKVNWNSLTSTQRRTIKFAQLFSKATGVNIKLIKSEIAKGKHQGKNGSYNPSTNTIELDVYAGRINAKDFNDAIIPTLSHEITHWMKAKSPTIYNSIREDIMKTLTAKTELKSEDLIAREIKRLEKNHPDTKHSVDEAIDEIVARACEDMLSNSNEARKLLNKMSPTEQQNFIEKVKETFENLIQWVNDLLALYKSESAEAKLLREYKTDLKRISKQWDAMLVDSIQNNQALQKEGVGGEDIGKETSKTKENISQENMRFQTRVINGNKVVWIEENILKENKGYPVHQFIADFIAEHIGEVYTIIESGQKVYIGEDLPGEYTQSEYTQEVLERNPNIIKVKNKATANIKEIIEIATNRKWEKAVHSENKDAKYGIYKYDTRFGFPIKDVKGNVVGANVYRAKLVIRNASDGAKYLYDIIGIKKDKVSSAWLSNKIASPTKNVGQKNNASNKIILNPNENVKEKNSDRDSIGRKLSKGQQEYFKDSTVRDENGNLLTMYRGDSNEITVFDRKKSKPSNLYGRGFYFTKNKAHAEQYGDATEYYLNIKNPLSPKQNVITKKQMLNFLKAIENDGEDYDLYNYGQDATAENVLNSVWGKDDFAMLQDINAGAIGDLVAAVELFNEVNSTTYDGIVLPNETVTFNSEQSKFTSNLNPTEDKDTRFSMRNNTEETKNLVAVHNLSPSKLLKTLKLGGLPMPSIAITRAREGYNNFGDISLVFNKETIDPKYLKSNHVYSGDAWTPTYPQVAYKVNEKVAEKIKAKIDNLVPNNIQNDLGGLHLDSYNVENNLNRNGDIVSTYSYNYAMKYAFLKDNNVNIELPTTEEPFYRYGEVSNNAVISFANKMVDGLKTVNSLLEQHSSKLMADEELLNGIATILNEETLSTIDKNSEEYQKLVKNPLFKPEDINLDTVLGMLEASRKYFRLNGKVESKVDYRNARNEIDEYFNSNSLEPEYEYWLKKLFSDIVAKEGIRNNKDLFTPSGNRRSFEALHYEHTLENVIKAMKEEGSKGIGGFGGGNIFGASTNEYNSIDEIKSDAENRMYSLPESKYEEIKKGFTDRLFELAHSLPIHKDSFSALDDAANMLIEAVAKFKTKSGMANYLRTESKGWANYSDYIVDDLIDLVNDIRNMPVQYFEAKPQRAVGFDEIKAVIMPSQESYEDDLSEVKAELEKLNIPILEYEYGDNNSRIKALNSLEEVRFSDRTPNSNNVYDLMGENESLRKDYEKLKADFDNFKQLAKLDKRITNGKELNNNQVLTVAGILLKMGNSKMDKIELAKEIKILFTYTKKAFSTEELTWADFWQRAYPIAEKIIKESNPLTIKDDYAKGILRDLRASSFSLDETQKKEAKYIFGDHWNYNFIGNIKVKDDAPNIDTMWQEWSNLYPDVFDADIGNNKINGLYEVISSLRSTSEAIDEYAMKEKTKMLAFEMYNQCWNVSTLETTADKYANKIKELKSEHKRMMNEVRDEYQEKIESQLIADDIYYGKKIQELKEKDKAKYNEKLKAQREKQKELYRNLRERKNEEIALAKEHGRDLVSQYKEKAERKTVMQGIMATTTSLTKKLLKNDKDSHIPEALKPVVANLINAIDYSSKQLLGMDGTRKDYRGTPTQKDIALDNTFGKVKAMADDNVTLKEAIQDALTLFENAEKVANNTSDGSLDLSLVSLDADLIDRIKSLIKSIDVLEKNYGSKFTLQQMELNHLKTLNATVKSINTWANNVDNALSMKHKARISYDGERTVEENDALGKRKQYIESVESFKNFFSWSNLLPVNAFKRLGETAMKYFNALRDAQDDLAFRQEEIINFTDNLFKKKHKEIRKWREEVKEFTLVMPNGDTKKVRMPVSYVMTLYCVSKQEDAKRHLYGMDEDGNRYDNNGGGMTIAPFKEKKSLQVSEDIENTIMTESLIKQITSTLTDEQRSIADELQNFINTKGSEWCDKVSLALYGIKKFDVENYFPITVSPNTIKVLNPQDKRQSIHFFSILNYGFTKSRNPNAKQSIEIGDIFDIFANHMSMAAIYSSYALPIFDIVRWYNYKGKAENGKEIGVITSIQKAFGKSATTYIGRLISDLNGQHEASRLGFVTKIFKNTKIAMVGNSLSVGLLQPTAYLKAMTKIPIRYLLKSALYVKDFGAKKGVEKAKKWCGIALWKSRDNFDTDISGNVTSKMLHDEKWYEKAKSWSLKGAGWMDEKTWGVLWNACEFDIRANRKDLEVGSDEFYEEVANKLRDVIYETQVVDSPLTRSDLMRSPDNLAKMITMFGSEMTVAYNMVSEAFVNANLDVKKVTKKFEKEARALLHEKHPKGLKGKDGNTIDVFNADLSKFKKEDKAYIKKFVKEKTKDNEDFKQIKKNNLKSIAITLTAYTLTSAAAQILNTMVQLMRDDEDKEPEEIMKMYFSNFLSDWLIFGKIPYVKEALNYAQGYSSSRVDTLWLDSMFKSIRYFGKAFDGDEGYGEKAIKESLKSLSYLSGLPMYNQYRDAIGFFDSIGILDAEDFKEMLDDIFN